jgi:S1-C subfamily serine protease
MTRIHSLLAAAAIIAFLALLALPAYAKPTQIKEQMVDPVVKIDEDCSGTNVKLKDGKFILTAAHCTTDRGEGFVVAEIRTTDKDHKLLSYKKIFYDTVRFDSDKDLALLKVRDPEYDPPAATIAEKLLVDEGSNIWVIGYPLAVTRTITVGLFNGYQSDKFHGPKETTKYRASANMTNGNSGGMLAQHNDASGNYELIGVTSMKYNANEFMGLFVTLDDIRDFLRLDVGKTATYSIDQR